MSIPFVTEFDFEYGRADRLSPLIRRVICNNPGPFTFTGTGTYIIGTGEVAVIDPGPIDDAHLDAVLAALQPDERVSHIIITHTHGDHSPASKPLQQRTGAPIYGMTPAKTEAADGPQMEEDADDGSAPTMRWRMATSSKAATGRWRRCTRRAIWRRMSAMRCRKKKRCSPATM